MTDTHPPRKMSARDATDRDRRSFLFKSAAVGVGASLVMCGAAPSHAESVGSCDLQATPFDALTSLKDSMYELRSAVYKQSFKTVSAEAETTIDYFAQLCDKVTALKAALVAERKGSAKYEHMKALADIGCAGAGQIKGLSDVGATQAQLSQLNVVSEQIRQLAYELLPEGQGVTLSVEATRILREIILIVDQQTGEKRRRLQAALERTRTATNEFEEAAETILARISEAIRKLYEPDSAEATAELVGKAGVELEKLLARLRAASMQSEVKRTELLIALVEGTRQWIAGKRAERAAVEGSSVFRRAVYRAEPAAPIPIVAAAELSALIYNFYPPESGYKSFKCSLILTQLRFRAWTKSQGVTRDWAVEMIRRGLDDKNVTCSQEYQGRRCQPDVFIQALADILLG